MYMIRNFVRQSRPWTKNLTPMGKYNRNDNIGIKVNFESINNCSPSENIDSQDNTLYHKSLYEKTNNYNYSVQSIVEDYNVRWKKNITVEDYLKNFTRKHRGAC